MRWISTPQIQAYVELYQHLLPDNFNHNTYIELHKDLQDAGISTKNQAIEHYLIFGRHENRSYSLHQNITITPSSSPDSSTPTYTKQPKYLINKKILIKVPTLSRPDKLINSIKSFYDNAYDTNNIYFIVTIDNKDDLTNNDQVINRLMEYDNLIVCKENPSSKIDAYNLNIDLIDFDILILSSDDMIVVKPSYDKIIIENMEKYFPNLDGVLWFDTGDSNTRTNTLAIVGREFYEKIKPIYKDCYTGYYCDDEFSQIAMKLGKMVRIEESLIKHNIPNHLVMSDDTTYLKSLSYGLRDRTVYKIRKKIQFDIPGIEPPPNNHNIPKNFLSSQRNIGWPNFWKVPEARYDDPISSMDLYVLENMDKTVAKMNLNEFVIFAENYFRDFRWTIPPIIHQIWLGEKPPSTIQEMMNTFAIDYLNKYKGFRYILWDDAKLKNLKMINRHLFDQETRYDCKSDIARLEILNQFGGFYIDADTVWLGSHSLSSIDHMTSYGIMIAFEKEGATIGKKYLNNSNTRCANSLIGATIGNPIIAFLIGQMQQSYIANRQHGVVASTGPDFIQETLDSLKPNIDVKILSHKYFYPSWWCVDPKNNPKYKEFLNVSKMSGSKISKMYPDAITFHKGWTAASEGIQP